MLLGKDTNVIWSDSKEIFLRDLESINKNNNFQQGCIKLIKSDSKNRLLNINIFK